MEKLQQQVRKARGRLNLQMFLGVAAWPVFGWLLVAAALLAAPKIWALGLPGPSVQVYTLWVVLGALGLGLLTAGVWTWLRRRSDLEAALEIDHRFGLKERISSTLALSPRELETEAGQALLADALRRVERIDVGERFAVKARPLALLPLAAALVVFLLAAAVPDAVRQDQNQAEARDVEARPEVRRALDELKQKLAEREKAAHEGELADAGDFFKELQRDLDAIDHKNPGDRKQAMVQLNNLAKQIKGQAQKLREAEDIKNAMDDLKDINQGPADKLAKALGEGDFGKAAEEINDLHERLQAGQLDRAEQARLQEQIEQMQEKLQQMADAHRQAQEDLQQQIEQAKQEGNLQRAGELQQQLEALQQQQGAMDQLCQMCDRLGQAADALARGDQQAAAEQLAGLQQQLGELKEMDEQLQMFEEALDQIAQAKDAMNCKECAGGGCEACQGDNRGQLARHRRGGGVGPGIGVGEGGGLGPEREDEGGGFDSQVRGEVGRGPAIVVGKAGGPNLAGQAREEIKETLRSAAEGGADPLTSERLPRSQRDHVKEYYDALREGRP